MTMTGVVSQGWSWIRFKCAAFHKMYSFEVQLDGKGLPWRGVRSVKTSLHTCSALQTFNRNQIAFISQSDARTNAATGLFLLDGEAVNGEANTVSAGKCRFWHRPACSAAWTSSYVMTKTSSLPMHRLLKASKKKSQMIPSSRVRADWLTLEAADRPSLHFKGKKLRKSAWRITLTPPTHIETLRYEDGCPTITIYGTWLNKLLEIHSRKEPLNPQAAVDACERAHDVWTLVKLHFFFFVPMGDLWRTCSCIDSDVHGPTVSADGVFGLPRRPVESQRWRPEVGACQDQPMMSWERKRSRTQRSSCHIYESPQSCAIEQRQ